MASRAARESSLRRWAPLLLLVALAAVLRLATLDDQSLWYDEAFTPVHTLHSSLTATLRAVSDTENTPPLWYVLEWGITRIFGTGAVALRSLSALAGIATVPVAWALGWELGGRRSAALTAALVAVNPLFVWYSQEARAYALYVLLASLALLCFLRAQREPSPRRMAAFALASSLALLTHYFAVFLLIPMALWLTWRQTTRRAALPAVAVIGVLGLALLPLIATQGGHGTQWIGRWPLTERLEAIPQYYLTGYSGQALGHTIELLVASPILAGVLYGLWRALEPREEHAALLTLAITACGVLTPVLLALFGADYLAPRNLVAAMVPLTALLAVVIASKRAGLVGILLGGLVAVAFTAITIDVDASPRLERGDWRSLARRLTPLGTDRAVTTVELGAAPLEYYLPLRYLPRGSSVTVSEIDEVGYAPLEASAAEPPVRGFRLAGREDVHGLILYRFISPFPRRVHEEILRAHAITPTHPEVLVPG